MLRLHGKTVGVDLWASSTAQLLQRVQQQIWKTITSCLWVMSRLHVTNEGGSFSNRTLGIDGLQHE
ncbi:hypothetical protein LEMLEM_LOCUS3806 [Lemmus lemmus]